MYKLDRIAEKLKLTTIGANHLFIACGVLLNGMSGYLFWKAGRAHGLGEMLDTIIDVGVLNAVSGDGNEYLFYADEKEPK